MNIIKKKCKFIKVGVNTLFRSDICFSEYFLAVEIDDKGHTDRDHTFEKRRQKAFKKNGCKFIRINTSNAKNAYDLDYEAGNVEAFIDEFKNEKIEKIAKKLKEKKEKEKDKELKEKLEKEIKKNRKRNERKTRKRS